MQLLTEIQPFAPRRGGAAHVHALTNPAGGVEPIRWRPMDVIARGERAVYVLAAAAVERH